MTTDLHVTQQRDGSVEHHWSVGDEHGSVSMTAQHLTGEKGDFDALTVVAPSIAELAVASATGFWLFGVVEYHGAGCGWPQNLQAEDCNGGGVASTHIAHPLWDRVGTAGLTAEARSYDWAYDLTDAITEALRDAGFRFDSRFGTEEDL